MMADEWRLLSFTILHDRINRRETNQNARLNSKTRAEKNSFPLTRTAGGLEIIIQNGSDKWNLQVHVTPGIFSGQKEGENKHAKESQRVSRAISAPRQYLGVSKNSFEWEEEEEHGGVDIWPCWATAV